MSNRSVTIARTYVSVLFQATHSSEPWKFVLASQAIHEAKVPVLLVDRAPLSIVAQQNQVPPQFARMSNVESVGSGEDCGQASISIESVEQIALRLLRVRRNCVFRSPTTTAEERKDRRRRYRD
jgi:hypothetical protein